MRGQTLNRKGARNADFLNVFLGLIVENLVFRMPRYCCVDLCLAHPRFYIRIRGNRLQRHMRYRLIYKTLPDVPICRFKDIVWESCAHYSLAGKRERDPRGVNGYPSAPPLLRDERGGSGAAGRVEHEVARVCRH